MTDKTASTPIPLSPEERYVASQLMGRSLFSAIQLAKEQEARKAQALKSMQGEDERVLRIPIPRDLLPQKTAEDHSTIFGEAMNQLHSHPIRMLVGGQEGFRNAQQEYYLKQKQQIAKELESAQKEYLDTLSKIKMGEENTTPCVDAFCNGIAHTVLFGKTASFKEDDDVDIEHGAFKRMLGDSLSAAPGPKFMRSAATTAAGGLMGTGAASAYLTYLLRKRMREEPDKYMQEHLPTRVELQPYA
jgi:hypothetical protein